MKFIPFILFLCLASTSYGQTTPLNEDVRIDTIITFDPITFEERIEVVVYTGEEEKTDFKPKDSSSSLIDTVIVFDPVTMKEEIIIIKSKAKKD